MISLHKNDCSCAAEAGSDDDEFIEVISECEGEETYSSDSESEREGLPPSDSAVPSQTPSTASQDKSAPLHGFNILLH